jgi:hypothetical protein
MYDDPDLVARFRDILVAKMIEMKVVQEKGRYDIG